MKINEAIRKDTVAYEVDAITRICKEIGGREPGSKEERAAQQRLADDMKNNGWADDVEFQEFQVAPKAFFGFSRIIPPLIALGIILYWFIGFAPLIFNVAGLLILFFQFLLYWRFLDPIYPKQTSANVIATKRATGEVKRRIYLSGHTDSVYEWRIFYHFGHLGFIGGLVYAMIGAVVGIVLSILDAAGVLPHETHRIWILLVLLAFIPGYLALFFMVDYKKLVNGANDNLTGCLTAVGVLKALKEQGIDFEHTEVVALLAGGEEAGLRGSKAFGEKYAKALKEEGVENVFIGLETFRDFEHTSIYVRDMTGTVKMDPRAVKLLDRSVARLGKAPLPHASVYMGASDAAAIQQAGIPAVTLASMDPAPARYYHTRSDNEDNLNPDCIALGLDLAIETVETFDEEGLPLLSKKGSN